MRYGYISDKNKDNPSFIFLWVSVEMMTMNIFDNNDKNSTRSASDRNPYSDGQFREE